MHAPRSVASLTSRRSPHHALPRADSRKWGSSGDDRSGGRSRERSTDRSRERLRAFPHAPGAAAVRPYRDGPAGSGMPQALRSCPAVDLRQRRGKVHPGARTAFAQRQTPSSHGETARERERGAPIWDSTFTPPDAGHGFAFQEWCLRAQGGGIEEPPSGSWSQRIGGPDQCVRPEPAPASRRTASCRSRGRPSHQRDEPARARLRATDNADGLQVVVPGDPPRLTPRAARIVLEILIEARRGSREEA